jgi:serine O-acetyltransferase
MAIGFLVGSVDDSELLWRSGRGYTLAAVVPTVEQRGVEPAGGERAVARAVQLWRSDLYRYAGEISLGSFLRAYATVPGFQYSVYQRLFHELFASRDESARAASARALGRRAATMWLRRYSYRYGIAIPIATKLGPGLYIGHFGGIVLSPFCQVGSNCNLSQGITIGQGGRGNDFGWPVLGDRVYVGPGAKIVGAVHIGDGAAVGANAVVTHDVPAGAVVAGVPARVIGDEGSDRFIDNCWPPGIRCS